MQVETFTCNNGKDSQLMVSFSEILVDDYDDVSFLKLILEEAMTQLACKKISKIKGGDGL